MKDFLNYGGHLKEKLLIIMFFELWQYIHKKRKELCRISELWRIFKRKVKNYEGCLNSGGYLKETLRIMRIC